MQLKDDKQIGSFSGGLAEIVNAPSDVTMSYLEKWFKGTSALGKAYEILGMPYDKVNASVLERRNGVLLVNLDIEQRTLYNATLLRYRSPKDIYESPVLAIDPRAAFNPLKLVNTLKILFVQVKWISKPNEIVEYLGRSLEMQPLPSNSDSQQYVEDTIATGVLPMVIAIGAVTEYFYHLVESNHPKDMGAVKQYIDSVLAKEDWFFKSYKDQLLVQSGALSFADFIKTYGIRSDRDFELECPRWHEVPNTIKARILMMAPPRNSSIDLSTEFAKDKYIKNYIDLSILRSNAKRLLLNWIDILRKQLISAEVVKQNKISYESKSHQSPDLSITMEKRSDLSGIGFPISVGAITGVSKIITTSNDVVSDNTIGIFPNSGTDFTHLFTKCAGIIFLRGGQTSHGAIVAREFGIPAITDSNASGLQDGLTIKMDGSTGSWKVL